jgi:pilus assembly protein CpaB
MLKGKTPLLVAVALGILAGAVAYLSLKQQERRVKAGWNLVPVVVAADSVNEGTIITYDMISQRPVPEQFVTSSVIKPDSANYIVGQKVLVPLQAGDPLLWSQFETSKAAEKLSAVVQKKGRAINIATGGSASVGGWIRPNDHVDIVGIFRDPQTQEQMAMTLLQNVVVLATGKITGTTNVNLMPEGERSYGDVSLLVLPEEAEILTLAEGMGALKFTLRNPEDVDVQEARGRATMNTLLTGERINNLLRERMKTITVWKGIKQTSDPSPN